MARAGDSIEEPPAANGSTTTDGTVNSAEGTAAVAAIEVNVVLGVVACGSSCPLQPYNRRGLEERERSRAEGKFAQ